MKRNAKIVCTLGPSSSDEKTIRRLIEAGMDVARLNFSHGTHDSHAQLIATLAKMQFRNRGTHHHPPGLAGT